MNTGQDGIELRWILGVIRRWWWLIAICTLVAGGVAFEVTLYMPPVYQASTILLVDLAKDQQTSDYTALVAGERLALTYSELLKSRPVLEEAITRLELEISPGSLAGRLEAGTIRDTQLIRLTIEDSDPARAAALTNTIAATFIDHIQQIQRERYAASLSALEGKIDRLEAAIDETQSKVDVQAGQRILAENDLGRLESQLAMDAGNTPDELEQAKAFIATRTADKIQAETEAARLENLLAEQRGDLRFLQQDYEQLRLNVAEAADSVLVAEPAQAPANPVQSDLLYIALAAAVGLMLGTGAAFLLENLNDTVGSPDEASQRLGLTTLGAINIFAAAKERLVVVSAPRSPTAEAFRVLAANLRFASLERPLRTLLVTSALSQEGKSLVAANLAATLAQGGQRVLLVDADLRRPCQDRIFELEAGEGLVEALLQGSANGRTRESRVERLRVVTSGEPPPNPAELLGSQRLLQLLDEQSLQVDIVVIDSPPVLAVADASLLASQTDGVLLVLRAGRTRTQAARQAVERLRQARANLIGAVLNAAPRNGGGYYQYNYAYGYGKNGRPKDAKSRPKQLLEGLDQRFQKGD